MSSLKWRVNAQGMLISPEAQKLDRMKEGKRKKKHKTNKETFDGRKLHRYCPKCGEEITKKRVMKRNDALGIYRDGTTVYICSNCNAVWSSKQTNKVWERRKVNPKPTSNKEFMENLKTF